MKSTVHCGPIVSQRVREHYRKARSCGRFARAVRETTYGNPASIQIGESCRLNKTD